MKSQVSVTIDTATFIALCDFLRSSNDPRDPVSVCDEAIWYWMDNAAWKPELLSRTDSTGYQWKSLFLPSGTQLRMKYGSKYHYANVISDEVVYEGEAMSPSAMANRVAQSSRNAWRDIWIKRPNDKDWVLADDIRNAQNVGEEGNSASTTHSSD